MTHSDPHAAIQGRYDGLNGGIPEKPRLRLNLRSDLQACQMCLIHCLQRYAYGEACHSMFL
jgi:hypothetical protein